MQLLNNAKQLQDFLEVDVKSVFNGLTDKINGMICTLNTQIQNEESYLITNQHLQAVKQIFRSLKSYLVPEYQSADSTLEAFVEKKVQRQKEQIISQIKLLNGTVQQEPNLVHNLAANLDKFSTVGCLYGGNNALYKEVTAMLEALVNNCGQVFLHQLPPQGGADLKTLESCYKLLKDVYQSPLKEHVPQAQRWFESVAVALGNTFVILFLSFYANLIDFIRLGDLKTSIDDNIVVCNFVPIVEKIGLLKTLLKVDLEVCSNTSLQVI